MNVITSPENLNFLVVFLAGFVSFFSPCVIPILPIYMGYLAGHTAEDIGDGKIVYNRKRVFVHTLFFIIGISISFFILGLAFTSLGKFFTGNKLLFTRIGGILVIFLGLFQLGLFKSNSLSKERKISYKAFEKKAGPLTAMLLGFTFSFGWTPCVGPTLSSVLIMAAAAKTQFLGNVLIFVYGLGFLIPFLLLGLFTSAFLNFFEKKQKALSYLVKIGGVLLIIIGISLFTGWMNSVSSYLTKAPQVQKTEQASLAEKPVETEKSDQYEATEDTASNKDTKDSTPNQDSADKRVLAPDFIAVDNQGNEHKLSDYKDKVVMINFWASWCGPCNKELPDIEDLYKEYGENKKDVIILGMTNPANKDFPKAVDIEESKLKYFIKEKGLAFPSLFNFGQDTLGDYQVKAFPTTYIINKKGEIVGRAQGLLTKDIMKNAIEETLKEK